MRLILIQGTSGHTFMCNLMRFGKSQISATQENSRNQPETSSATPEIHPTTLAQTPHVSPQTSAPFPKAPAILPQRIHDAC